MQDWSYYWHNDLQVTIELSNQKWPPYSSVSRYWNENRQSLINFLKNIRQGIGIKTQSKKGKINITKIEGQKRTFIGKYDYSRGEFYKVLPAGTYKVVVETPYKTKALQLKVSPKKTVKYIKIQ